MNSFFQSTFFFIYYYYRIAADRPVYCTQFTLTGFVWCFLTNCVKECIPSTHSHVDHCTVCLSVCTPSTSLFLYSFFFRLCL